MRGRPATFRDYVRWFALLWEAEIPDRLHSRGVWRDYGKDAVGGSKLGAPSYSDPFRRYIEGKPAETDFDPRIDTWTTGSMPLRPLHAALDRMGRDEAHFLFQFALSGFKVASMPSSLVASPQLGLHTTRSLLHKAYSLVSQAERSAAA